MNTNILPIQVLDEGVLIPKVYLHNADEVEVVVTADYILIKPKTWPAANGHDIAHGRATGQMAMVNREQERVKALLRAGFPTPAVVSPQEQMQRIAALKASPAWDTMSEREKAIAVLRAGGLLTELSPEEQQRAAACTVTLEEVVEGLSSVEGQPLSELIIEMRGPKE